MPNKKRAITAEDLYKFELITGPQISPDGNYVVYAQQRVSPETEKKFSNLWIAPTEGGEPRQFTYGDQVDNTPTWSPDGARIAFVSNRRDEKQPQIYLIPFRGGEAHPLTELQGTIGALDWSPDSSRLIVQFRAKDSQDIEREEDEDKKKLGVVDRHYDRVFYKFDGVGFLPKERWHLWSIDTDSGEARQLTGGEVHDELSPSWSPDGKWIVFTSNRNPDPDLEYDDIDLFVIPFEPDSQKPVDDVEMRKIETPAGEKQLPTFSPDGQWIAYFGQDGRSDWWKNTDLWMAAVDGSSPPRNLSADLDFTISHATLNDLNFGGGALSPPTWSPDGQRLYFQIAKHGSQLLMSVDVNSGKLETVIDEKGVVGGYSFDRKHHKLAYFFGSMRDPGQIWVHDLGNEQNVQITRTNSWLKEVGLGNMEEIWIKGQNDNDIQGWVLKPTGFDSSQQYASILEIHGGPLAQYGEFFMHEFYYLAAQGYVVYFSNPRGGQGYGEAHAKAIWGDWGSVDYLDLMAWADYVEAQTYIDPERMGVTGGSYGGYMSLWIIGHTHRFKSAAAQRVVSNFTSMWGSSDLNWVFQEILENKSPFEDVEKAWKHSPIAYIGNATTPTLIIHSEEDHRCPIEQGEQAFVALKTLGVDTEMVRYPNEPHGLSRQGRTDRRISRLEHIARWMDKYLG
ncbi:MAG: S9 family peptidase [Chloroflexota bacterium]|nr:S9 family peptidase [Chloroflexota bacterium]